MKLGNEALTFDDVLLQPGKSTFTRNDIELATQFARDVYMPIPFVSSPMDTVTEHEMAIELGRLGGVGVIHRNLTIEAQAEEVSLVKAAADHSFAAAAIGTGNGYERRLAALVEAGTDAIVIDTAHGYTDFLLDTLAYAKKTYPKLHVVAGSIATPDAAMELINAGADALRVGMGPGAICTTRIVSGMGVPQLTAIMEVAEVAQPAGVPVIADGGINYPGDITKALAAGASSVMMGRLFAATEESPGEIISLQASEVPSRFQSILNGAQAYRFKAYRGMGSIGAMERGRQVAAEDEFHGKSYAGNDFGTLVPEGVEGLVPCSGSVAELIGQLTVGLTQGMFYTGCRTIPELYDKAVFRPITQASLHESHPHDIFVTR